MPETAHIYKLSILHSNGQTVEVLAARDVLDAAANEWRQFVASGEPTDRRIIDVHGHYDDIKRSDKMLIVDLSNVIGMAVVEMY